MAPKAAIVMGSDSDFPVLVPCIKVLKEFGIEVDVNVISAHRTPEEAEVFAKSAEKNGIGVIIAAAGKAAHLGGVIAAHTVLPVIGLPIKSSTMDGLDSLLSIVQMPKGIPVATVAINGGDNAGILAAQILSVGYPQIKDKLRDYKLKMKEEVNEKNIKIKAEAEAL